MKAISLVKFFTLVVFLVIGAGAQGAEETKAQCRKRILETDGAKVKKQCTNKDYYTPEMKKLEDDAKEEKIELCEERELEKKYKAECDDLETEKEAKNKCDLKRKDYFDALKKMKDECDLLEKEYSNGDCRKLAKNCQRGLNAFDTEGKDSESASKAAVNILGIYAQMKTGVVLDDSSALTGCVINNDEAAAEKAAEKKETNEDKIRNLREEIAKLKEDATDADNDFNKKRQDVEEEMLEIEEAAEKEKFTKMTENQKNAGRMQEKIMASEKKRKDNLTKIADLQPMIANLAFEHQELNLNLSDRGVSIVCKKKATDELKAKTSTIDPKTGKVVNQKFSMKSSGQLKKDVKFLEIQCLQAAALEKQKKTKEIIDKKRRLESAVTNLETENSDEAKAIENEMKQMEELKKIATEEENKAIESKTKKLNSLNKSVMDMEKHIADKKRTYEEKALAKEARISELMLNKQDLKPKFHKVSKQANTGGVAAVEFMEECCMNSDQSKNHISCSTVITNDSDVVPKGARAYKPAKRGTSK